MFERARRSHVDRFPITRYGALAASMVAALSYPAVMGLKPALAGPAGRPVGPGAGLGQVATAYDALASPDAIGIQLASDQTALAQTQAQVDTAEAQLRQRAVDSYVDGSPPPIANPLVQGGGGYDPIVRKEYLATVTGNQEDALHRLADARAALKSDEAKLVAEERDAQMALAAAVNAPGAGAAVAASASPASPTIEINGPQDFAVDLLKALGDPLTSSNISAIVDWIHKEGGGWNNVAQCNPLNSSMRMPGSHAINGDGVQSYTSWSEGLIATVATLNNAPYHGILAALSSGSSEEAVKSAVESSPWGTGSF